MQETAQAVLAFWFGAPGSPTRGKARAEWFRKDEKFDDEIRRQFGEAVAIALAGGLGEWCATAGGSLARILLLDQFTRNIFRGTPRAFAGDERALATAEEAVARGFDRELPVRERWFMYMPFEHSESKQAQHRSLELFGTLAREMGDDDALVWARKHAEVVFRFGRYPHRNAILGRVSTPEEEAYLREPGTGF
ncbi:MAG TPA: DUF924 family protein [Casimicrobiaceae bacterium]